MAELRYLNISTIPWS